MADRWFIGFVAIFVVSVLWGVWRTGRWLLEGERWWGDALSVVMSATVLRRDRVQTLSVILERTIEVLGASSGTLHVSLDGARELSLAHVVNVERLDLLAKLPENDPLVVKLRSSREPFWMESTHPGSRWTALSTAPSAVLGAVRLRSGKSPDAIAVLAWSSSSQAEASLPALQAIQRYAEQVLADFAELEARAADVQALGAALQHHELLTRTAAHDLSNKLASVQGLLGLAADTDGVAGERAALLTRALDQLRLSEPLLDELSDPDREIEAEPLAVEELVQLTAAMVSRRRRDQAVDFRLDIEPGLPTVWGERAAVLRILDNLLTNALKHNADRPDLRVWLRVWRQGTILAFEVGDNGAGISPAALPHLFEFGYRVDSTGKVKGHGLGLWSSRRLVEALGGQIWAESPPGSGARFRFTLPTIPDEPPAPGQQSGTSERNGEPATLPAR